MKNLKRLLVLVVTLAAMVALASCGGDDDSSASGSTDVSGSTSTSTERKLSDYEAKTLGTVGEDTFKDVFTENWQSLNYLTSAKMQDSDWFANFVDGLVETDRFGAFVPALEASHTVTDAATEGYQDWTFTLKDAVWTDYEGTPTAYITAQDFVTAAQYILTPSNGSETTALWFTFVEGAEDWYNARYLSENYATAVEVTDEDGAVTSTVAEVQAAMIEESGFASVAEAEALVAKGFDEVVGIHAVDGNVVYTVNGVKPYFYSVLSYSSFLPLRAEYILSKGQDFGKNAENIEYCGAYLMDTFVASASAELKANVYYWDAGNVNATKIKLIYNDLASYSAARDLYEAGSISGFGVSPKDEAGWEKYVTGSDDSGTVADPYYDGAYSGKGKSTSVYAAYFNLNRGEVSSENEKFGSWSSHTTESYENTKTALNNSSFRLMFTYGIDYVQYTTDFYGKAFEYQNRGWVPSGWLTSDEGKDYTYYFAKEFVENNPYAAGVTVDDASTQLYNEATANIVYSKESMEAEALKAYNALSAEGVTFPVKVEISGAFAAVDGAVISQFFGDTDAGLDNNLYAMVDGEKVDLVDISIVEVESAKQEQDLFYGGYCDYNRFTGWGPDYADPLTFLHCFVDGGDIADNLGVQDAALSATLAEYTALVEAADAIQDTDARYAAFAAAEYNLVFESAIIIPFLSPSSTNAYVSKVIPYSSTRASSGLGDSKYKLKVVGSDEITADQFAALKVAFKTGDSATLEAAIEAVLAAQ